MLLTLPSDKTNSQNFEVHYNVSISLDDNSSYEIALIGCNIWFSWYNISHECKSNFIRYFNGHVWETLIFPSGYYHINNIINCSPFCFKKPKAHKKKISIEIVEVAKLNKI
jgi:hypothetical protein